MRNPKSLFNKVCLFMNTIPVGSTYKTSDYKKTIGQHETSTRWKRGSNSDTYVTLGYRGRLRQAGFTCQVKRGEWQIIQHIPSWFDSGHLSFILNGLWDSERNKKLTHYDGMTRSEIIAKLDHDRHHPNGVIPKVSVKDIPQPIHISKEGITYAEDSKLREQYPHNIEGAEMFNPQPTLDYMVNGPIGCTIEKIAKSESQFANISKPKYNIAEITNMGLLRSSISTLDLIITNDSVLHARVINAIAILQDIEKSMSGKINAQLFNGKL